MTIQEKAIEQLERISCHLSAIGETEDYTGIIHALPLVTPKRSTGKWIIHPKGGYAHLVCSNCLSYAPLDCKTNYCPDCGANMESEDEE